MGSMQWLGREIGAIPAFASRTQENQENLCRDGMTLGSSNYIVLNAGLLVNWEGYSVSGAVPAVVESN
jgi:hypothetical protein